MNVAGHVCIRGDQCRRCHLSSLRWWDHADDPIDGTRALIGDQQRELDHITALAAGSMNLRTGQAFSEVGGWAHREQRARLEHAASIVRWTLTVLRRRVRRFLRAVWAAAQDYRRRAPLPNRQDRHSAGRGPAAEMAARLPGCGRAPPPRPPRLMLISSSDSSPNAPPSVVTRGLSVGPLRPQRERPRRSPLQGLGTTER